MQGQTPKKIVETAYHDHGNEIFRFCMYNSRNRDDALDITQDVFIKTLAHLEKGKGIDKIRPFLYRVAKNCIIDLSRRKSTSNTSLDSADEALTKTDDSFLDIIRENDSKLLFKMLDSLDVEDRQLLEMRYLAELSLDEIADTLEKRKQSVSVMIHRAEKKLQKLYSQI